MLVNLFTSKGTKLRSIPDSWDRLTVEQFQKIIVWDKKDLIELFSILSGIDRDKLYNAHDPTLEEKLIRCSHFISQPPQFSKDVPDFITLPDKHDNGVKVKIPKNTASLSIGQSIMVRQKLDGLEVYEQVMAFACAVFLQPLVDGEPNEERIYELEAYILKMPIVEIYPLGFFLLSPLTKIGRSFTSEVNRMFRHWLRGYITSVKRLRRVLKLRGWNLVEIGP